ncbi:MAG: hypothetical protein IJ587_04940 [Synergistaceae bacterium]|nr:hypothetical protein [Synergistaceae bacterium]
METSKTKSEWLKWYKDRTGCKDLELMPDEHVFFHHKHGFITFFAHNGVLELHNMCGDGKKWQKILTQIMKDNGLTKLRAYTERNPQAWIRKYGGHILGYYMEADINELKE